MSDGKPIGNSRPLRVAMSGLGRMGARHARNLATRVPGARLVAANSYLIEPETRAGMRRAATTKIPLYPEFRGCAAPSTERILEIFAATSRHHLYSHGVLVKTFAPEITDQQQQVLDLLGLPAAVYTEHP